MSGSKITNFLRLPKLKFTKQTSHRKNQLTLHFEKTSRMEVYPKCANPSVTCYDKRVFSIKDTPPLLDKMVILKITKRRFLCKSCKKPFTETIQGIIKRCKSTIRFRKHILWSANKFADLKRVQQKCRCSAWMVYNPYYEHAAIEVRKIQNPWGKNISWINASSIYRIFCLQRRQCLQE